MQRKHLLFGAIVALPLLAVGGVAAFAASGTSGPAATFVADVASHLGISTATLESAVQQARLDQVQQMLSSGKITSARADRMEADIKAGKLGPAFGFGHRRGGPRMLDGRAAMQAAATYLGLTPQQLRTDLQGGKSLSDIASATSGKTVQGLEDAITTSLQQTLQQAVTQGHLTQEKATVLTSHLSTMVQNIVTRTGHGPSDGGPWGPPAYGAPQGMAQGTN